MGNKYAMHVYEHHADVSLVRAWCSSIVLFSNRKLSFSFEKFSNRKLRCIFARHVREHIPRPTMVNVD